MARAAIVVTGLPTGGKTTVAKRIAAGLNWPLLDKDVFLERLFAHESVTSLDDRRRLSRLSDKAFRDAISTVDAAVLVSHWRPVVGPQDTGTPPEFIIENFDKIVEVHCICSVETAATRFRKRTRHSGHMDKLKSREDITKQIQALSHGYPLGLGDLLSIETEGQSSFNKLLTQIKLLVAT